MIAEAHRFAGVTPGLAPADIHAAYWMGQATLRLRREICWCWHQREPGNPVEEGKLPPSRDRLQESLDLQRHAREKARFFREDAAAGHLSGLIATPVPDLDPAAGAPQGSWAFVASVLALDEAAQFLLGLCLAARLDGNLGPLMAACANDASRPFPTLSLLQRLWDEPLEVAGLADGSHPLYRFGLLAFTSERREGAMGWGGPVEMAPWLAVVLAGKPSKASRKLPFGLRQLSAPPETRDWAGAAAKAKALLSRLRAQTVDRLQVMPLLGPKGCAFADWAASLDKALGRVCVALPQGADPARMSLFQIASACWLLGFDLLLPETWLEAAGAGRSGVEWLADLQAIPVRLLLPTPDPALLKGLPAWAVLPPLTITALDYDGRKRLIHEHLGPHAAALEMEIAETARRFRYEEDGFRSALKGMAARPEVTREDLLAALSLESAVELGHLAQEANPRFVLEELVLPPAQHRQMGEIILAMGRLTEVHYEWGTARAWNEGGLSALFCGPPGTGKTMAAEAVAAALDIPLYRIDLSQVVNKYIGETEKNLRRIFDATERTDCVLFFDEADALFGKRTEVKDAHDRFANIEISYLLERMERFKGLAILASNRRKDIDEAFLRRLRHVVEFPMPGAAERERIWRRVFPAGVDVSQVDFGFLSRQFPLAGGHIRSIAFNACLLSAAGTSAAGTGAARRRVDGSRRAPQAGMTSVLVAVKRELDKMNRPSGPELFGPFAGTIQEIPA